jgi:hypothetical protein
MKYQYVVILKKTGQRATELLSALLCLFSALTFFYVALFHGTYGAWLPMAVATLLLIGLGIVRWSFRRRQRPDKPRYRYLLLLAALGWMSFTPAPWVGAFFIILTFLEYQTKRPLEIGFDHDRVVINTLIKQQFDWAAFNNVILKDGLLTLDFKSNRLIQKEVTEDDEDDDADEEEFNAYCRSRLAAVSAA